MNRALAAVAVTFALLGIATTAAAQEDPVPPEPTPARDGSVRMELVDQTFDLAPDGTIELTYRIVGDLDTVADLALPTTTTTTTTSSTSTSTSTTTTVAPEIAPAPTEPGAAVTPPDPSPPPATPPPTTVPPTTIPPAPPPPPAALTLQVINYQPLDDPTELTGLLGTDLRSNLLADSRIIDGVSIPDIRSMITVESPTEAFLEVSVPTDSNPSIAANLEFDADGIYPIVVELSADGRVVARHGTVVERRGGAPTTPPTVDLSLFAAIDDPGPSGTEEEYAAAVDKFAGLVVDAAALEAPITMAVPPSVVTSAVASGAVDGDDPDLLADDILLAAPATPFDVSTAVAVGRSDAFVSQLRAGEDDVAEAIGKVPVRDVWPATKELSGPAAQVLRDLGVRYLAMPAEIYRTTRTTGPDSVDDELPPIDRFIEFPLPDGGRMPALIVDEQFGAAFATEATEEILAESTPAEWAIQTIAGLRLEQFDEPRPDRRDQRSRLISVPGLGAFDPRLAVELERMAETTEAIRFSPATDLSSATAVTEVVPEPRLPDVAGPSLEARLERIGQVAISLQTAASMLPVDDPRPAAWIRRLDSFVSTAFDEEMVNAELDELLAEAQTLRDGVVAPEPFTFTLTGREGAIDIRVGNDLDEPLNVVVRFSSPRLEFPEGDVAVTLVPGDDTTINVPVVARSNGTSPVTVDVLTPSGDPLTEQVTLTSRVNALTGLGQVLTAALFLMLLTWWFSHWRARRRESTPADPESVEAE